MKQVSYPPFVVFFDTLAVFLFLLMMNQNKPITIEIPENKLFPGAEVLYKKDEKFYYARGDGAEEYTDEGFHYSLDCDGKCNEARETYGNYPYYILIPDNIFNDISKLTAQAFIDGKTGCKSLKFIINEEGKLDYNKTGKENECLKKIYGFDEMITMHKK